MKYHKRIEYLNTSPSLVFLVLIMMSALLFLSPFFPSAASLAGDSIGQNDHNSRLMVRIFNKTPGYMLEVNIDKESETTFIDRGDSMTIPFNHQESMLEHLLVARAYTETARIGRRQIGKEFRISFNTGDNTDALKAGSVAWQKVFTFEDFFPNLKRFPSLGFDKINSSDPDRSRNRKFHFKQGEGLYRGQINDLISNASREYRLPEGLLSAVIEIESAFNTHAVSRKGALGLMQLMPDTCKRFSVERPLDPDENIKGGAKYLSYLIYEWSTRFPYEKRLEFSLAAYNAGEEMVELSGGIPPYKETESYIRKVLNKYKDCPDWNVSFH